MTRSTRSSSERVEHPPTRDVQSSCRLRVARPRPVMAMLITVNLDNRPGRDANKNNNGAIDDHLSPEMCVFQRKAIAQRQPRTPFRLRQRFAHGDREPPERHALSLNALSASVEPSLFPFARKCECVANRRSACGVSSSRSSPRGSAGAYFPHASPLPRRRAKATANARARASPRLSPWRFAR